MKTIFVAESSGFEEKKRTEDLNKKNNGEVRKRLYFYKLMLVNNKNAPKGNQVKSKRMVPTSKNASKKIMTLAMQCFQNCAKKKTKYAKTRKS